jgi:hypothetical protein
MGNRKRKTTLILIEEHAVSRGKVSARGGNPGIDIEGTRRDEEKTWEVSE